MSMSVGKDSGEEDAPISDINTTPLVDVMLVLLIIFLITVPVVLQTVPVKLPEVTFEPTTTKPENVNLSVKGDGAGGCEVYWGLQKMNSQELIDKAVQKLKDEIKRVGGEANITEDNMPEAHIRGDVDTPYKCIGGTIYTMQRAGFARVGFISNPDANATPTRL
ncbi:MAG: biopolymer transporter ExbD [Sphingomicrobium sp.]